MRGRSRRIVAVGSPTGRILRTRSRPITVIDRSITRLVADMLVTMRRAHGVGLAAVQVGVPLRVLIADPGTGPVALINPTVRRRWGSQLGPEGCLSMPGVLASVRRSLGVVVEAQTVRGRSTVVRGTGLLARILQHEIDHLNGVLFIDRVKVRRGRPVRALPRSPRPRRLPAPRRRAARQDARALGLRREPILRVSHDVPTPARRPLAARPRPGGTGRSGTRRG